MVVCQWIYRNKPHEYFQDIFNNHAGVMKPYIKDNNGDPASIINGQIKGLFFSAVVGHNKHGPMPFSYFGDTRFQVPAVHFFQNPNMRLYFADFYCTIWPHYVTLVMTKTGSLIDKFCRYKLIELNILDNNFLCYNPCLQNVFTCNNIRVEVLYTGNVHLMDWILKYGCKYIENIPMKGQGQSTAGGLIKKSNCPVCNLDLPPLMAF